MPLYNNFCYNDNEVQKIMAYRPNGSNCSNILFSDVRLTGEHSYAFVEAMSLLPKIYFNDYRSKVINWQMSDNISPMEEKEEYITRSLVLPPEGYVCHHCKHTGHYIQDCPRALHKDYCKTHYQGLKQCKGEFKCDKCKRKWVSVTSWANVAQMCNKCKVFIYPHKQMPIAKDELQRVIKTNHAHYLCQRCIETQMDCRSLNSAYPKAWCFNVKENCGGGENRGKKMLTFNGYISQELDSKGWSSNKNVNNTFLKSNHQENPWKTNKMYTGKIFSKLQRKTYINGF